MTDLSYRSPKTEVHRSPIHGQGLFAKEAITAGEIVAVKGGYVLTRSKWTTLEKQLGSAEIQISEGLFYRPGREASKKGWHDLQQSLLRSQHSPPGQIVFVAMRDIKAGEELTHDWATTDDLDYVMECRCGSSNCRGTISGQDWMKPELQEKYQGWFCWFIQRKIDALSSIKSLDTDYPQTG
jgi:uncharacterized protein